MWRRAIPTGPERVDPSTAGPGETLDRLAGAWWIYQLERGQRYTTDDVVTAWTALGARPDASSVLDLGAGSGSVGLLALLRLDPAARLVCVEIQARCAELIERSARLNGIGARVDVRCGDLRSPAVLGAEERFELVVTNPPYLPPRSAVASPYPQRAAARLEQHGDIFDFCRAASRALAPGGVVCLCHAAADERVEAAAREAGLKVLQRREVIAIEGRAPLFAIHLLAAAGRRRDLPPLTVRLAGGARSEEYRRLRRQMLIEV
ncbi:MAG: methyltransferase [Polyangia bacterium]